MYIVYILYIILYYFILFYLYIIYGYPLCLLWVFEVKNGENVVNLKDICEPLKPLNLGGRRV